MQLLKRKKKRSAIESASFHRYCSILYILQNPALLSPSSFSQRRPNLRWPKSTTTSLHHHHQDWQNTTPNLFIFCEIQIAFIKSSKPSNKTSFLFNPCALRGDISGFNPSFCFADFNCLVVNKHTIAFGRRELLKKKEDGGCSLQKEFFWF